MKIIEDSSLPRWKKIKLLKNTMRKKRVQRSLFVKRLTENRQENQRQEINKRDLTARGRFLLNHYGKTTFKENIKTIKIEKDFGIEKDPEYFFEMSQQILKGYPIEVIVDLNDCPRIWPSGVMLLCSYYHWIRIKADRKTIAKVTAKALKDSDVAKYINFCGLKSYFENIETTSQQDFDENKIVKIMRETSVNKYDIRINQFFDLVKRYTDYDKFELKRFKSIVLTELFINLSEHGVNYKNFGYAEELGWYVIAQVHEQHGFISICVADNGIGIRNSLVTGPLSNQITKLVSKEARVKNLEGEYILQAINENISGAEDAKPSIVTMRHWKEFKLKGYEQGSHRGMGFSRIQKTCPKLNIDINILSNQGYLKMGGDGSVTQKSFDSKIFIGTLFNVRIPIKKADYEESYQHS